jgi:hypothetical protein
MATADDCRDLLHRAGWSVGEAFFIGGYDPRKRIKRVGDEHNCKELGARVHLRFG